MALHTALAFVLLALVPNPASASDSTEAGRFVVEHPTLLNLGFEWAIRGDANRNASVAVEFRAAQDRKASDVVVLDVRPAEEFTDYFVIVTGQNPCG